VGPWTRKREEKKEGGKGKKKGGKKGGEEKKYLGRFDPPAPFWRMGNHPLSSNCINKGEGGEGRRRRGKEGKGRGERKRKRGEEIRYNGCRKIPGAAPPSPPYLLPPRPPRGPTAQILIVSKRPFGPFWTSIYRGACCKPSFNRTFSWCSQSISIRTFIT